MQTLVPVGLRSLDLHCFGNSMQIDDRRFASPHRGFTRPRPTLRE